MKTISYQKPETSLIMGKIWLVIKKYERLFFKYWQEKADEAMQEALFHAVDHYDSNKGDIENYIAVLAKTILKRGKNEAIGVDFIDDLLAEDQSIFKTWEKLDDFLLFELEEDKLSEFKALAWGYPIDFCLLCERLNEGVTINDGVEFTKEFKTQSMELARVYADFKEQCLDIYEEHRKELMGYEKFIEEESE